MNTDQLTIEELATNDATYQHIQQVQRLLNTVIRELLARSEKHDQSKLQRPEVEYFARFTPKLAASTYGSDEYKRLCAEMKPALDHHYGNNRHHPEHFAGGVDDMNLIDLLEMLVDWKAATMRHNDGNIRKSVKINADRFGISPQLTRILENTVDYLDF